MLLSNRVYLTLVLLRIVFCATASLCPIISLIIDFPLQRHRTADTFVHSHTQAQLNQHPEDFSVPFALYEITNRLTIFFVSTQVVQCIEGMP